MACHVSLIDHSSPGPDDRLRIERVPTIVPEFSIVVGDDGAPLCSDYVLVAEHPYMFWPPIAVVTKYICPTLHAAGSEEPDENGFVEGAAEKSMDFDWVLRSTCVCPAAIPATAVRIDSVCTVSFISRRAYLTTGCISDSTMRDERSLTRCFLFTNLRFAPNFKNSCQLRD